MKPRPFLASVLVASLAVPPQAFAQTAGTPVQPVQPVPYATSQPVPYPGGASEATVVNVPRTVGPDVVYLKGGGMIRGTLIEQIPNDHATVDLSTGQQAVIPWDRIDRIVPGGGASSAASPPARSAPPSGPAGSAIVHIDSDAPVVLDRREGRSWVFTCNAPCDMELPLAGLYRISGADVRNTDAFHLNARPGEHVSLEVSTASSGSFKGGIALTSIGGAAMLIGGMVFMFVWTFDRTDDALGVSRPGDDTTWNTVGWVMLAGGAAALVVGILVLTGNSHSKMEQAVGAPAPRNDAWLRVPQWHDDKAATSLPKVVGVPIFETKF